MTVGQRMKARRKQLGLNAERVAEDLGISPSTVYRYENGDIEKMGIDKLKPIAEVLHTTPSFLMGWTDDPVDYESASEDFLADIPLTFVREWQKAGLSTSEMVRRYQAIQDDSFREAMKSPAPAIPFIRVPRVGAIACGDPILAEQNIEGYDKVPAWTNCDFTLVCKGDSMIGARIFDGDIVCIRSQPDVENGEIAAVQVGDDEATLKRVKKFPDHIILEPENPNYRPLVFWDEEMKTVRILGKATHFISEVR